MKIDLRQIEYLRNAAKELGTDGAYELAVGYLTVAGLAAFEDDFDYKKAAHLSNTGKCLATAARFWDQSRGSSPTIMHRRNGDEVRNNRNNRH